MNDPVRAVILGIVEGLTEFLPVSSTGHMILVEPLLGIREDDRFWTGAFDIFIQVGAIFAVLLYFWRRLVRLSWTGSSAGRSSPPEAGLTDGPKHRERADEAEDSFGGSAPEQAAAAPAVLAYASTGPLGQTRWQDHILVKLFVAFLPAAIIGKLAGDYIEAHLKTPAVVAGALIVGGAAIIWIERSSRLIRYHDAATIPLRVALGIGLIQCLAMIPGTSRSAATIMGALLLGLSAPAAAEFSFFLAIPTMFAAGGYSLFKHRHEIEPDQLALLGLGFSVAFVVALGVVAAFMRYIQTHRFTPFAVYRILVGGAVFAALWAGFWHH